MRTYLVLILTVLLKASLGLEESATVRFSLLSRSIINCD